MLPSHSHPLGPLLDSCSRDSQQMCRRSCSHRRRGRGGCGRNTSGARADLLLLASVLNPAWGLETSTKTSTRCNKKRELPSAVPSASPSPSQLVSFDHAQPPKPHGNSSPCQCCSCAGLDLSLVQPPPAAVRRKWKKEPSVIPWGPTETETPRIRCEDGQF